MAKDFDIVFPKKDQQALFAAMNYAQRRLGASLGGAIKMAGFQLAQTMGTSTRVAPKKRRYKVLKKYRATATEPKKMLILVYVNRGGKEEVFKTLIEGGVREANKSSFVRVGMSGLAKSSWKWAANHAMTGSAVSAAGVSRSAKQWGSRYAEGASRFRGDDPFYRISNNLPYIREALIPGATEDAMRRAASGLEQWVDTKLKLIAEKAAKS